MFACRDVLNKRLAKAARLLQKRVAEAELHDTQLIVVTHCKQRVPDRSRVRDTRAECTPELYVCVVRKEPCN